MALRWLFLMFLTPLLVAQEQDRPDTTISRAPKETERCRQPQWDSKLRFTPKEKFYGLNEEVTLSCPLRVPFPLAVIRCAKEVSPGWKNVWEVKDIRGAWHRVAENLTCPTENCSVPQWDERLHFVTSRKNHKLNEEFTLTCPGDLEPSFPKVKCAWKFLEMHSGEPVYGEVWWGRSGTSAWMYIEEAVECVETCQRPERDSRLQLTPNKKNYKKNEEVVLSCPDGFQPSFTKIKCLIKVWPNSYWNPIQSVWSERDSRGDWINIQSSVECIETCQRPWWDPRLQLVPEKENYKKNEEVMLSCPDGFQPSFTHVKCAQKVQIASYGQPVYADSWLRKDRSGDWISIQSDVECISKGGTRSRMLLSRGGMLGMCLGDNQHGKVMVFPRCQCHEL